jgi:hypothetical protein
MTTIILVIIGVLIAAASALFMVFYGGTSLDSANVRAEAGRLVSEGQQISYATDMFYRTEGRMPGLNASGQALKESNGDAVDPIQELREKDFLAQRPLGVKLTQEDPWKMVYGTDGMIYSKLGPETSEAATEVCRQARKQLNLPNLDKMYKCDASDYFDASYKSKGQLPDVEPCCIKG